MGFKDLKELLTDEPKRLPVGGKMIEFPGRISAEAGLTLLTLSRTLEQIEPGESREEVAARVDLPDDEWNALVVAVLGKMPQEFIADGLSPEEALYCFQALMAWHLYGQDAAEQAWDPPKPNRAQKRAPARGQSGRPASTATKPPSKPASGARGGRRSPSTGGTSKQTLRTSTGSTSKTGA